MTTVRCQICQCVYNAQRLPYILQPCSHGLCSDCVEEYIVKRNGSDCPTCRQTIIRHTLNFDLKDTICVNLDNWKREFIRLLGKDSKTRVTLSDEILPAVPLIMCRLENKRNDLHSAIVTLVRNCTSEDVYRWVEVLQFPNDWEVELSTTKMLRHYDFLDAKNADWLLEYL